MRIFVQEALRGRRCASLRSAATSLRADESGRSTPSAPHRASPSPADTPAPKKSNWEVIEHFSSNRNKKSPTSMYKCTLHPALEPKGANSANGPDPSHICYCLELFRIWYVKNMFGLLDNTNATVLMTFSILDLQSTT
ncbi:unnamed protein product [Euphydryas editha]|uniref:Uncharacterized protein n=1 Tax=Euphydryas editha TaxID=104508 RepID=A0AAU9UZ94_EUPED|nr:unnamed protein product [Euphydryas editha]